jgi:hypothetical protein
MWNKISDFCGVTLQTEKLKNIETIIITEGLYFEKVLCDLLQNFKIFKNLQCSDPESTLKMERVIFYGIWYIPDNKDFFFSKTNFSIHHREELKSHTVK